MVSLRVGPDLFGRVQIEPGDQFGTSGGFAPTSEIAEQVDNLAGGERPSLVSVARHVGDPTMQLDDVSPRITTQ